MQVTSLTLACVHGDAACICIWLAKHDVCKSLNPSNCSHCIHSHYQHVEQSSSIPGVDTEKQEEELEQQIQEASMQLGVEGKAFSCLWDDI